MTTTTRTNRDRRAAALRASLARQNERDRRAVAERIARRSGSQLSETPAPTLPSR